MDYFSNLPDEILYILFLLYLDVPEWHQLSLVSHRFRNLALDKHLHKSRLVLTKYYLNAVLPLRPSPTELYQRNILLSPNMLSPYSQPTRIQLLQRLPHLRSKDALNKLLPNRPSRTELINRNLLMRNMEMGRYASQIVKQLERQRIEKTLLRLFLQRQQQQQHFIDNNNNSNKSNISGSIHQNTVNCDGNCVSMVIIRKNRKSRLFSNDGNTNYKYNNNNSNQTDSSSFSQYQNTPRRFRFLQDIYQSNGSFSSPYNTTTTINHEILGTVHKEQNEIEEEEEEEVFIRKSVRALASTYSNRITWLTSPPAPKAPPLIPSLLFNNNNNNKTSNNREHSNNTFKDQLYDDNQNDNNNTNNNNGKYIWNLNIPPPNVVTDMRKKFETLAVVNYQDSCEEEQLNEKENKTSSSSSYSSSSSSSHPSQPKIDKPLFKTLTPHQQYLLLLSSLENSSSSSTYKSSSSSSATRQGLNKISKKSQQLSRTSSTSSVSSLASSNSNDAGNHRQQQQQQQQYQTNPRFHGVSQGTVASLRQRFISLTC